MTIYKLKNVLDYFIPKFNIQQGLAFSHVVVPIMVLLVITLVVVTTRVTILNGWFGT